MPQFNTSVPILEQAVQSILTQTFRDFEFIIIDDASTNDSCSYLKSIKDERVRIIWNKENLGVAKSLNKGLAVAKGKYVARMDADDISEPQRFEVQFQYMEDHPNAVVCGTGIEIFSADTKETSYYIPLIKDMEQYRIKLLFRYPGPNHPTIFIRNEILIKNQIQYPETLYTEDYGLYSVLCEYGDIYTIPEILFKRRSHPEQVTKNFGKTKESDRQIIKRLLTTLCNDITDEEFNFHFRFFNQRKMVKNSDFITALKWSSKLLKGNKINKRFCQRRFAKFIYTDAALTVLENKAPSILKRIMQLKNHKTVKNYILRKKSAPKN